MDSPFTSFLDRENVSTIQDSFLLNEEVSQNPFLEIPETLVGEFPRDEATHSQDEHYFEGELTSSELALAIGLNAGYMVSLGWVDHLKEIDDYFYKLGLFMWSTSAQRPQILAPAVAKYQEMRGLKPTNKGVLAIGTWSVLQGELGFHHLTVNKYKINIERAKLKNSYYEKTLWGSYKNVVFKNLAKAKVIMYPLPLDSEHFALAIAEFQASKGKVLKIDGVLGRMTHHYLISDLPEEQLVARIFDALKAYTDSYINALSSFSDTVNNPSKEDIKDLEDSYRKESLSDVGSVIFETAKETFEGAIKEIPFASGFIKAVTIIREFQDKYDKYKQQHDQMVIANKLKDFLVDERNIFADLNSYFTRNYSELTDSLSKYAKQNVVYRSSLDTRLDKLQALDIRQQAVFQIICEKWINLNKGFINIEFFDNWQIRKTQISAPFGSRIIERLMRNDNGKIDLEKFNVNKQITYYPFTRPGDEIFGPHTYLTCLKTTGGSIENYYEFFVIGTRQQEISKAHDDFIGFIYRKSLPVVTTITSMN